MSQNEILLESGTNEVEILEFLLGDQSFGLNVAKVTSIEIFEEHRRTSLPAVPPGLMGTFMFRKETIPLLEMSTVLQIDNNVKSERPLVISVEFNNFILGLYVDGVNRIHRMAWDDFEPLDTTFGGDNNSILGSIHIDDREILILDIESVSTRYFTHLSMEKFSDDVVSDEKTIARLRSTKRLVVAEDSTMIRHQIVTILKTAGYSNLHDFDNGQKAFDYLTSQGEPASDHVDMMILDIEMPAMDGLTLCRKFKRELGGTTTPVVMFSSLINEQMAMKCREVGADGWITKPEIGELVKSVDEKLGIVTKE